MNIWTRRCFLAAPAAAIAGARAPEIRKETFLRSPGKGTLVQAFADYVRPRGVEMVSIEQRISRSDTIDVTYHRRSPDNGRTWSDPVEYPTRESRPEGTLRRHPRAGYADPRTGLYRQFWTEGVLPGDNPLEGLRQWNLFYRSTADGGATWSAPEQLICNGAEFGPRHPLPGVFTGKTCVMLGDTTCCPVLRRDGAVLLPAQVTRLGPDGKLHNPGGGYTWTEAQVLIGRPRGRKLVWEAGEPIPGDPARTTRGMVEPTLGILAGGRVIAVMRGSNDRRQQLPSHKWVSYSSDGGRRWTKPVPWTYDTGDPFYSPSACSQLLAHSSGRLFWLGNIAPENPQGNRPRYPFHIGEVDRKTGLLRRDSIRMIDDRAPGESDLLTLSNFYAREDRETREIVLHMTRGFAFRDGWEGDALLYRIPAVQL